MTSSSTYIGLAIAGIGLGAVGGYYILTSPSVSTDSRVYTVGETLTFSAKNLAPSTTYISGVLVPDSSSPTGYLAVTYGQWTTDQNGTIASGTFYLGTNVLGATYFFLVEAAVQNNAPCLPPNQCPPDVVNTQITVT